MNAENSARGKTESSTSNCSRLHKDSRVVSEAVLLADWNRSLQMRRVLSPNRAQAQGSHPLKI